MVWTLDLALLDVEIDTMGRNVKERALHGKTEAGDALDDAFIDGMLSTHPDLKSGYDRYADTAFTRAFARNLFVDAKVALSSSFETRLPIPGAERDVTRDEFEQHVAAQLGDSVALVSECLGRGRCRREDIARVVLTGGSSLIPGFQAGIRTLFPHLDESRFAAEIPGDPPGAAKALRGVPRIGSICIP